MEHARHKQNEFIFSEKKTKTQNHFKANPMVLRCIRNELIPQTQFLLFSSVSEECFANISNLHACFSTHLKNEIINHKNHPAQNQWPCDAQQTGGFVCSHLNIHTSYCKFYKIWQSPDLTHTAREQKFSSHCFHNRLLRACNLSPKWQISWIGKNSF